MRCKLATQACSALRTRIVPHGQAGRRLRCDHGRDRDPARSPPRATNGWQAIEPLNNCAAAGNCAVTDQGEGRRMSQRPAAAMPAGEALVAWMQWFVGYVADKAGMAPALNPIFTATDAAAPQASHDRVYVALGRLIEVGQGDDLIRATAASRCAPMNPPPGRGGGCRRGAGYYSGLSADLAALVCREDLPGQDGRPLRRSCRRTGGRSCGPQPFLAIDMAAPIRCHKVAGGSINQYWRAGQSFVRSSVGRAAHARRHTGRRSAR